MKILFVTNNLYPNTSANSAIVYRVADALHDRHDVEILLLGDQTDEHIVPYRDYRAWFLQQVYHYTKVLPGELPKREKITRLMLHPELWLLRYRLTNSRYPKWKYYRKKISEILKRESDIDAIIAVGCPFDTIFAATKVAKNVPVIAYKLDPWGYNYGYVHDKQYWRDEQEADAQCSAILVTPPIYQDYESGRNLAALEKVHQLEFPNLLRPNEITASFPTFEADKVHCAYVGQLYADIRKPDYMFKLFRRLEEQDIVLHVIGNTEVQAQRYREQIAPNVILHGRVSQQEARAYMQAADVLVNLGNTVSNQLPSKTIDYIATGKPILNLCKIPDCPTIPYMEKYPLAMNVMEADGISEELVERVAEFCKENAGKRLPFEEVKELFYECTPEYVGEVIYKTLADATKKN